MYKAVILMSTYNGEKYLKEQIDSVLAQKDVDVTLIVRDDGSTDNTCSLLDSYSKKGNLIFFQGDNLKPAKSFLYLLDYAYQLYGNNVFYGFSDQDDVWQEDKIINAIHKLEQDGAELYCSSLTLLSNNPTVNGNKKTFSSISPEESLLRNYCVGCTMVFSGDIAKLIVNYSPEWLEMHDSWIYRVAICCGKHVTCDENSYIFYRIHDNNVVGVSYSFISNTLSRIKAFRSTKGHISLTAKELLNGYGSIIHTQDLKELLILLSNGNLLNNKLKLFNIYRRINFSKRIRFYDFILKLLFNRL